MGGEDMGPSPQELLAASLASCTAITMEMYAKRKGWNVDGHGGRVSTTSRPSAAASTRFELIMKMPAHLSDEQVEQAAGHRRQVPCAPHARGRSGLRRTGRDHLSSLPRRAVGRAAGARGGAGDRRARPHGLGRARPALSPTRPARCTRSSPAAATTSSATPARSRSPAAARTRARRSSRPRCARPTRRSACRRAPSTCSARLEPTPTFVTNYAIYPFVGLIEPGFEWVIGRGRGRRGARAADRGAARRATASGGSCARGSRSGRRPTRSTAT